ncbi:hypothetical protein [Noviherbaspirillum sp. Root189]|uniref:hypothetical protein n=1 Tax=Noviherbaspirillum sp. Root189 TaxID=1736487 RepID=UPI00070F245B|nr:hypothetical protein [Noviherbaspirillum sp. Root189]KRB73478.1 hypothetical protein ASE07_06395 [Noviherbaspirillum sp. Root189]
MTEQEIMQLFDKANTPCTVLTAHSPWHQKIIVRFARLLLENAQERYELLKQDYDLVKDDVDGRVSYAYLEGVKVGCANASEHRECGHCRWNGTAAETLALGAIDTLCPVCRDTTELARPATEGIGDLEPVEGDQLPTIGSNVLIHLNSKNAWVEHTVTGYYAWADLGGNDSLHRVFVRVVDTEGYSNARLLKDVRPIAKATGGRND